MTYDNHQSREALQRLLYYSAPQKLPKGRSDDVSREGRSVDDRRRDLVANMNNDEWIFDNNHKLTSIVKLNTLFDVL